MKQDFHGNFRSVLHVFCLFLRSFRMNRTHSGMDEKISSLCSSQRTKLPLTLKIDDVASGRRGLVPHGRLWAV